MVLDERYVTIIPLPLLLENYVLGINDKFSGIVCGSLSAPVIHFSYCLICSTEINTQRTVEFGMGSLLAHDPVPVSNDLDYFNASQLSKAYLRISINSISNQILNESNFYLTNFSYPNLLPTPTTDVTLKVPSFSQMPFELNPSITRKLCASTCLYMVLCYYLKNVAYAFVQSYSLNRETSTNGIWPQLIYAANQFGIDGSIVIIKSIEDVKYFLYKSIPIIVSISFLEGEIPGFPFGGSNGHMMVICGIEGDHFLINDPAQRINVQQVLNIEHFMQIWLKSRPMFDGGVGLVFWPK